MTMRPVSLVSVFLPIDEQRPTGHLQSISLWFGYFLLCTLCSRLFFSRFQFTVRLSFSDRWTGFVSDQLVLPTFLILHDFTGSCRRRYYIDSMVHVRANMDRRYAIFGLLRTTLVCCTVFCPNFPDFFTGISMSRGLPTAHSLAAVPDGAAASMASDVYLHPSIVWSGYGHVR